MRVWLSVLLLAFGIAISLHNRRSITSFDHVVEPFLPKQLDRTALLLTAHPDDEVMFFSPTVIHLVESGWEVRGLCLSTGNATGLGATRARELVESFKVLGLSGKNVLSVDDPLLQDGMDVDWPLEVIARHVKRHLSEHSTALIVTFDSQGISGHPNHVALPAALRLLEPPSPPVVSLRSPSIFTKYMGLLWALWRTSRKPADASVIVITSSPLGWWKGVRAMLEHRSQLVWFRWLYLAFSHLMWVNELQIVP